MKQQVEESVKEDIIKLGKVNAPTREIAEHVSKSSGQMFTTTDIRNRINKYNSEIHGDENDINDFFNDIIKDGGNVAAKYDENKRGRVLLVQTQTQFKALSEARPKLFFTDTTFGTNKEEYKLHLQPYVSVVTEATELNSERGFSMKLFYNLKRGENFSP